MEDRVYRLVTRFCLLSNVAEPWWHDLDELAAGEVVSREDAREKTDCLKLWAGRVSWEGI
jgi:hypothetical protein